MSLGTIGTDTGGSIRIPAAACGVVGLKAEWGHISAAGVVPLSRQLDHVGPLAASVGDAWLLYNALHKPSEQVGDALDAAPLEGLRFGRFSGYLSDRLDADVGPLAGTIALRNNAARPWWMSRFRSGRHGRIYLLCIRRCREDHARTLVSRRRITTPVRLGRDGALRARRGLLRALRGRRDRERGRRALGALNALVCLR